MFCNRNIFLHISRKLRAQLQHVTSCTPFNYFRMVSTLPKLPVFEAIASHDPHSTAVIHSASGRRFNYGALLQDIAKAKERLYEESGTNSLDGQRIAFLVENGYDYVVTLLSILGAHSIAVPLSPAFPVHELKYIIDHSQASLLLTSSKYDVKAQDLLKSGLETDPRLVKIQKMTGDSSFAEVTLEEPVNGRGGIMLFTSGTTSRPKGVLLPQSVMTAQSKSLLQAWDYSSKDHLLHVLPLHHIHGAINALMTPLFAGSAIEFLFPFNANAVWDRLAAPFLPNGKTKDRITFFTVVPTVYNRLLATHKDLSRELQDATRRAISPDNMRLTISGSAALPSPIKKAWADLSNGNVLLERYGMTEVGMALSCGLDFADRVDGSVGWPLPTVQARLVDTETNEVIRLGEELHKNGKERDGEIQLRGPTIFKEYWRNEKATREEFVEGEDGQGVWFKTGDVAVRRIVPDAGESEQSWAQGPMYFIRGRKSADIIKTGGEKVSALEVERELLSLPQVAEAAVMAVPSGKWGQKVGAIVILKPDQLGKTGKQWGPMDMRRALRDRIANYKIPQVMKVVDEIPKNAMGKINKKELVKSVFGDDVSGDEMGS